MSKTHSIQRARNFRMRRSSGGDTIHWGGLFIAIAVLALALGTLYGLYIAGVPFMGGGGIVAFFIGYAIGTYAYSVRPMKLRYDYAFLTGIGGGIVMSVMNVIPFVGYGTIIYNLSTAHSVLSSIVGLGVFGVLTLYIIFGFVSTKQAKV